jgi:hypothetical protein
MFIDCSYEGDLMAKACELHCSREETARYNETFNGVQLMDGTNFPTASLLTKFPAILPADYSGASATTNLYQQEPETKWCRHIIFVFVSPMIRKTK